MSSPVSAKAGAATTKGKKEGRASKKGPTRMIELPSLPYALPYNWAGNDQVVAAVLKSATMGDYADYIRGKHTTDPIQYWAVYCTFQALLTASGHKVTPREVPYIVDDNCKNPKILPLITSHPSVPVTPAQLTALHIPQHLQAGELDKALTQINAVKLLHYMLRHLDHHLKAVSDGPTAVLGYNMSDWIIKYMVLNRIQNEFNKRKKKVDPALDFYNINTQHRSRAPEHVLTSAAAAAAADGVPADQTAEDDAAPQSEDDDIERIEIPISELMDDPSGAFTKEHIEAQVEMLRKFLANIEAEEAELNIDPQNRVKNVRPGIKPKQLDRLLARCMTHVDILSDGTNHRMTDPRQTTDLADAAMRRLAAEVEVPEDHVPWADDATIPPPAPEVDAQVQHDWLQFQKRVSGGHAKSQTGTGYVAACESMGLDPTDPTWVIDGRRCTLHPWQVIGADWIRRSKREHDVSPLLADDCGLGKTIQGLAALYADYLDAKAGRLSGPYQPSMIVAPGMVATNWINDNAELLCGGLDLWLWQGRAVDAGNLMHLQKRTTMDLNDQQLKTWITALNPNDPETMRKVIVTTYGTGPMRSLYMNGQPVMAAVKERKRAQRTQEAQVLAPWLAEGADDSDAAEEALGEDDEPTRGNDSWTTSLSGLFYRVVLDESHKAKSTRTNTFRWVQQLTPTNGYIFLSATPMPNTIEDMKCYLLLNWMEDFADEEVDPKHAYAAIGMWSMDQRNSVDDEHQLYPTEDCEVVPKRAHLNPKLFSALVLPDGGMTTSVASRLLPAIQSQIFMRRTMSTVIEWTTDDGESHSVRVGEKVPPFQCRTVELAFKDGFNMARFRDYHVTLSEELSTGGSGNIVQGPHQDSGKVGKRNMAIHKRLQVLSGSLHAERFTQSYAAQSFKTGVEEMNILHEFGSDRGLSAFYAHASMDRNTAVPTSRLDMAEWLFRGSPKLCWLANYVNEKRKVGKRVVVFAVWPVCQWLLESTLALIGFHFQSVRSEMTLKLRLEAIAVYCDVKSPGCDGLIVSYACGGTGSNLQKGSPYMVHFEICGNFAAWLQANGRLHRLGQPFVQEIITLVMDASYDRTMLANICHKYHPELIASLDIADDATMDGKVRPATTDGIMRAAFDEEYGHRIIADMMGLRRPERNRDPGRPPRRQIRAGDGPDDVNDDQMDDWAKVSALQDAPPSVPRSNRPRLTKRKRDDEVTGPRPTKKTPGPSSSPLASRSHGRRQGRYPLSNPFAQDDDDDDLSDDDDFYDDADLGDDVDLNDDVDPDNATATPELSDPATGDAQSSLASHPDTPTEQPSPEVDEPMSDAPPLAPANVGLPSHLKTPAEPSLTPPTAQHSIQMRPPGPPLDDHPTPPSGGRRFLRKRTSVAKDVNMEEEEDMDEDVNMEEAEGNAPPKNRKKAGKTRGRAVLSKKDKDKKDQDKKDQDKKDQAKKDQAKKDQAKKDQAKKDQAKKDQAKKDKAKKVGSTAK